MISKSLARRKFVKRSALALFGGGLTGCSTRRPSGNQAAVGSPGSPPIAKVRLAQDMELFVIQTGWVSVKEAHLEYGGIDTMRLPAILASSSWTDWLPITAYVIDHPEGLIAVDTGETSRIVTDRGYTSCDRITGYFYRNNLAFNLSQEDEIAPQLFKVGIDANAIKTVVMTHLHSDHMGGMESFSNANFLIGRNAINGHTGALMCRLPTPIKLTPVALQNRPIGAFSQSAPLTSDGRVSVIPTPGHAIGHQSVLIQTDENSVCIVGDAAFSEQQVHDETIGAIVENVADARRSVRQLKEQQQRFGTVLLPTHDPANVSRLSLVGEVHYLG